MAQLTPAKVRHLTSSQVGVELPETTSSVSLSGTTAALESDDPVLLTVQELLDEYGGVLFTGPPGTSKSYYADLIAQTLAGSPDRVRKVQFHPSYQYEDFMQGYVATEKGFALVDRHFVLHCTAAQDHPDDRYVLVIDELSRADPGRVFGEALTYLERSNRGKKFFLSSGREMVVPPNLDILATMNPLDRGVDEVDAALNRRFAKYAMDPSEDYLNTFLVDAGMSDELRKRILIFFRTVNQEAAAAVNPHAVLGHTYFQRITRVQDLIRLWDHQLRLHFEQAYRLDSSGFDKVRADWNRITEGFIDTAGNQAAVHTGGRIRGLNPTPISVAEYGFIDVDPTLLISDGRLNIYPAVEGKDLFAVKVGSRGVQIQARGFVGIIPLNDDLVLHVTPRVPLRNLARLLSTVQHTLTELSGILRSYDAQPGMYPSLISLYAASLRASIEGLQQHGLLRRYERRETDYTSPRGRINVGRTLTTAGARGLPTVSTSYFERTSDIPENQVLLAAVYWLTRYTSRFTDMLTLREVRQIRRNLNAAYQLLANVTHDARKLYLRDPVVTGSRPLPSNRPDYRPAIDLALSILGEQAIIIDQVGDRLSMPSLLINLDVLFEDYIREVLRRTANQRNWPVDILDGNVARPAGGKSKVFTGPEDELVETAPDAICRRRDSQQVPVVIEVKYKPVAIRVERVSGHVIPQV